MMSRRAAQALCFFGLFAGMASMAKAETRRIAIVVGSNRGDTAHAPLRFAEADAATFAAVLTELGGLAATDVLLLRGPAASEVYAALDEAKRRIARWHAESRGQVVLFFYFSGHSDGMLLELAGQGLPFSELRRRLTQAEPHRHHRGRHQRLLDQLQLRLRDEGAPCRRHTNQARLWTDRAFWHRRGRNQRLLDQ
jgi:hypothetical protein